MSMEPMSDYNPGKESALSREIKIISEVEKIWITYDIDQNGYLECDEMKQYLSKLTIGEFEFSEEMIMEIIN